MVRERMAEAVRTSGREPGAVGLVAVSKYHPASSVEALLQAGQLDFGENYVQEALAKQDALADPSIRWHFIGGLQSNKAKFVAGRFSLVHSVDSSKLARSLHKKVSDSGVVQDILLQVSLAGESQKSGITEDNVEELAVEVFGLHGLRLVGLMTMPPFFDDPEGARPYFARLRELRDRLQVRTGRPLPHLSMGMTGDFVSAIEEGATLVRIGTMLFGPRPARQQG